MGPCVSLGLIGMIDACLVESHEPLHVFLADAFLRYPLIVRLWIIYGARTMESNYVQFEP